MTTGHKKTTLRSSETNGLGEVAILHPEGTFALTPASLISIRAIVENQHLLDGPGIDWGAGSGCLAILAARIPAVEAIIGLEKSEPNLNVARANAQANSVRDKVCFMAADSYVPFAEDHLATLDAFRGHAGFVLANPPASENDDGFGFRRIVLRGASDFLRLWGVVFLSISYQYGTERIKRLTFDAPGFSYGGVLASTEWVPFDLSRPDLLHCLELYATEEQNGGLEYSFADSNSPRDVLNAQVALKHFRQTGKSPLSKWQTHLFTWDACS